MHHDLHKKKTKNLHLLSISCGKGFEGDSLLLYLFIIKLAVFESRVDASGRTRLNEVLDKLWFMNNETFSLGVAQLGMWFVHGVVVKMGSWGMEMPK